MNTPSALLTGTGLFKSYGMARALAGVDIVVTAGESLAVMGPSGSGKSTLLHCLAGIERPDSGEVLLDGERSEMGVPPDEVWGRIDQLREPARSELRRTAFGFVFQSGQLLPELPADENVALPLMLGGGDRANGSYVSYAAPDKSAWSTVGVPGTGWRSAGSRSSRAPSAGETHSSPGAGKRSRPGGAGAARPGSRVTSTTVTGAPPVKVVPTASTATGREDSVRFRYGVGIADADASAAPALAEAVREVLARSDASVAAGETV